MVCCGEPTTQVTEKHMTVTIDIATQTTFVRIRWQWQALLLSTFCAVNTEKDTFPVNQSQREGLLQTSKFTGQWRCKKRRKVCIWFTCQYNDSEGCLENKWRCLSLIAASRLRAAHCLRAHSVRTMPSSSTRKSGVILFSCRKMGPNITRDETGLRF